MKAGCALPRDELKYNQICTMADLEQFYRSLFDDLPNSIKLFDRDGRCLAVNPAGLRVLRRRPEEVIGQQLVDLWPQEAASALTAAMTRVLKGEQARFEAQRPGANGVPRAWDILLNPIRDAEGNVTEFSAILTDVTQRDLADETLRTNNRIITEALQKEKTTTMQLEAALEHLRATAQDARLATMAKSEFLANMSHEIRTPMTAILGFAETMQDSALPDAQRQEMVQTIQQNGRHLLSLLNDILDLSKIEAGKMTVEQIDCSPCEILAEIASLARPMADMKGLTLAIKFAGPIPEVIQTDPVRLRQILVNLVGNAIKFTDGGEVRVIASFVPGPPALMRFEIQDTGVGMSDEIKARLFQPFTQADRSMARKYGGTGLGLAISRQLAERLGGAIGMESGMPGGGSHFWVTVYAGNVSGVGMLENPDKATLEARASTPSTKFNCRLSGSVLVAEDGPDNQRLISHILGSAGAQATIVGNGEAAVKLALAKQDEGEAFDVILMDMQMPVMDGLTATETLRSRGYRGAIIALTAHAMASDRQRCLDAGCDDYVSKPIDRRRLLELVNLYAAQAVYPTGGPFAAANPVREAD
jgi:PAS domain S-box-containing protein